jgi:hypothetical protein
MVERYGFNCSISRFEKTRGANAGVLGALKSLPGIFPLVGPAMAPGAAGVMCMNAILLFTEPAALLNVNLPSVTSTLNDRSNQ